MTVQTDECSAAAETCSVTGRCHAILTADCSTLWKAKLGWPTDVDDLDRSMPTAVEEVLELSLLSRRILADMEVQRRGSISVRGLNGLENGPSPQRKPAKAA